MTDDEAGPRGAGQEPLSSTPGRVDDPATVKEQVRRVADELDPTGVGFDTADALQTVVAGNYIVGPDTDRSTIPLIESLDSA